MNGGVRGRDERSQPLALVFLSLVFIINIRCRVSDTADNSDLLHHFVCVADVEEYIARNVLSGREEKEKRRRDERVRSMCNTNVYLETNQCPVVTCDTLDKSSVHTMRRKERV